MADKTQSPFEVHGLWAPGVLLMRHINFKLKALLISLSFFVPMGALLVFQLETLANDALQAREDATREHVEIARGIAEWAYDKAKAGEMPEAEAQKLAASEIGKLRYSGQEYFWINDLQAVIVMHPIKPELNGKDASGIKDPTGFALFKAFADEVAAHEQGFVHYLWPKPGKDQPVEKLSYVKGFKPWGWVIGSGIYIDDLRDAQAKRRNVVLTVFTVVLLLAGYVFISFYKVNRGGLMVVSDHLNRLSEGDLTTKPSKPWGRDEPAALILDIERLYASMYELIRRVRHSARELNATAQEIASASTDLSARTESAAASLEQQAAAMEEMGSTISTAAERIQDASTFSNKSAELAEHGGSSIGKLVQTMGHIQSSSQKISDIIGVIDGIAFQTNILALNAAVEAARAGESGRGFAVVAGEVRSLAQNSAQAAKEIKSLITTTVEQVESGASEVVTSGETIRSVVENTKKVNLFLNEIAGASREQTVGVDQIVQAIQRLDNETQQNSALSEETNAAAMALRHQADLLMQEIANFRVA